MAAQFEILRTGRESECGRHLLLGLESACDNIVTQTYLGKAPWLILYGVGARERSEARDAHLARGGHVLCWDLAYFGRGKVGSYMRVSIDHQHPQAWLDRTAPHADRWEEHRTPLRDDAGHDGHILLIGLGRKSHAFLGTTGWEQRKLAELRKRFPGRRIVYRPKKQREGVTLDCETRSDGTIQDALRGASLLVCRHSNCAVDAVIAGVPFEAEDGAAVWLNGKPYTKDTRLDFLRRLSYWQWKASEAEGFFRFFREVTAK